MNRLMGDQDHLRENLIAYIRAFTPEVRDIFERFDFYTTIESLHKNKLLYRITEKFANVDLHPDVVDNAQMGLVFEDLWLLPGRPRTFHPPIAGVCQQTLRVLRYRRTLQMGRTATTHGRCRDFRDRTHRRAGED
jgi:hypothetical protein